MHILLQILTGSAILLFCMGLHLLITVELIRRLHLRSNSAANLAWRANFKRTSIVFLVFLGSHTLHIYIWAFSISALGALESLSASIYFALVTYTTVGYGDVTLGPEFRIFGAMASVSGILLFGLTTAFLVSYLSKVIDAHAQQE